MTTRAPWIPVAGGEYRCRLHHMRAADCPCPPVEDWIVSPYLPQTPMVAPKRSRKPHSPRTSIVVGVTLRPEVAAALDEARGTTPRAVYAGQLILAALGVAPPTVKRGRPRKALTE